MTDEIERLIRLLCESTISGSESGDFGRALEGDAERARTILTALTAKPAEPADGVQVRIAVCVDATGDWSAAGIYKTMNDNDGFGYCIDTLEPGEARYIVTARLPLPSVKEVAGTVETATE